MSHCKCGCGKDVSKNQNFLPGHGMKLRAKIEHEVGGLLNLEVLVDTAKEYSHGAMKSKKFGRLVKKIFAAT